jgi:hypothetical protein
VGKVIDLNGNDATDGKLLRLEKNDGAADRGRKSCIAYSRSIVHKSYICIFRACATANIPDNHRIVFAKFFQNLHLR